MKILTTREAADALRVTPETIRRYVRAGAIDATTTPGGDLRIASTEIDRFLPQGEEPTS